MNDEPLTWHYGLMAERWAKYITDTPELTFYQKQITRFGEPVLDVACGTGRVLLALLRAGIDVDGCDFSGDMLHYCRQQAQEQGFSPSLYQQPMHAFDIPRKYRTIYICSSFGLAGSRENDLATLQRCHAHLEEGGALLLNIQAEYTTREAWDLWLTENLSTLPQPWPKEGSRRTAADGSESIAYFRIVEVNPFEQTLLRQVRLEKWVAGEKVAVEEYTLREDVYLAQEVLLMLKVAGFSDISVTGDYTDEPATVYHEEIVFRAITK